MRTRSLLVLALLVPAVPGAQAAPTQAACLDSSLTFETSALERLIREPRAVLEEEEQFWEQEPAQRYTTAWAAGNGFTLARRKWRSRLSRFAELDEAERLASPLVQTAQVLLAGREQFLARALPHVCSFLPQETDTGVPVYFTAFIPPRAFVTGGIVINVDSPYWKANADNIFNTLTHEIWHVGYSRLREHRTEPPLPHRVLYAMLEQLQNEGIATYVAYRGRSIFPAPDEIDFRFLDDPAQLRQAFDEVNGLFRRVGAVSEKQIGKLSWKIGVDGRAYYVAGAQMARVLDERVGREALIGTVTAGPASFVRAYNAEAAPHWRIEVPDAETIAAREAQAGFPISITILAAAALCMAAAALVLWRRVRRHASP
jgi:hypothetical protein